jgi:hypothetical protein
MRRRRSRHVIADTRKLKKAREQDKLYQQFKAG